MLIQAAGWWVQMQLRSPKLLCRIEESFRGRLRKALGQLGFWEFGRGGLGEGGRGVGQGGSVYKQPETEVDDSCHS